VVAMNGFIVQQRAARRDAIRAALLARLQPPPPAEKPAQKPAWKQKAKKAPKAAPALSLSVDLSEVELEVYAALEMKKPKSVEELAVVTSEGTLDVAQALRNLCRKSLAMLARRGSGEWERLGYIRISDRYL